MSAKVASKMSGPRYDARGESGQIAEGLTPVTYRIVLLE